MKFWCNDGNVVETPFRKFEVSHQLGRNHFYSIFLPIIGEVPLVEIEKTRRPQDGFFRVVQSKKSGHYLIVPSASWDQPDSALAFISCWAGFRGGIGLVEDQTTAKILYSKSTHVACEGVMTVAAILLPGQKVTTHSTGRRNDDFTVFENKDGEIVRTDYERAEFEVMISPDGIQSEDYEEV